MTINLADNSPRDEYTVNQGATQQVFTVSFEFFSDADLNVYVDGTLQTLTTDYLTADNNDVNNREDHTSGTDGFIHLTDSITGGSGGTKVVITRSIDLERTSDFPSSGPFDVAALNTELDKTIAMIADAKDGFDRALKLADSDPDVSMDLPLQDNRKGKVLAFNSTTGAPEAGPTIGDVQSIANVTNDIATLADIEDGTDATDAIQTVAGISANVTTVAGVSSNVTTVAGISANVTTVAGDAADITTVAGDSADIQTLADISSDITTAAGISSDITTVAGDSSDIQSLAAKTTEIGLLGTADAIADMNTLATSAIVNDLDLLADVKADIETLGDVTADITTVAGQVSPTNNIATVAGDSANIGTVAGISADVTTVAGISANTTTVAGISSNVTTVAGISSNVTTVSNNQTDIATVAGISSNVSTVAGISANVTTVAGDSADIQTVAGATTNIGTVATDIANVNSVGGSIANVNTVASNLADVNSFADTYFISATAPSSPTVGDLWFDTTNNVMKVYGSGGFINAGSAVNGTANRETFAVGTSEGSYDGSTTVFPIEYDAGYIDVYLNGIKLDPDNDFTATNGTSVTLSSAAATGDIVDMVGYGTFELADFSVGAANDVDLTGLADDQILRYNSTSGNFEAEDLPTGIPDQSTHSGKFLTTDGSSASWATVTQATGNELENLSEDTTPQLGGDLDTNNQNINFGDSDKAQFGAGNDLQIYHDGSNSYVHENGTGSLNILASDQIKIGNSANSEVYAKFNSNGNVELRHDNSVKLETTSTGIDVTGRITTDGITEDASGNLGVGKTSPAYRGHFADASSATRLQIENTNNATAGAGVYLTTYSSGSLVSNATLATDNSGNFKIFTGTTAGSERMRIDASGKMIIGGTTHDYSGNHGIQIDAPSGNNANIIFRTSGDSETFAVGADANLDAGVLNVLSNDPMVFKTNDTERMRITNGGDLQFNSGYGSVQTGFGCRMWVNFNGTGTLSIRDSGNVSSITDSGVGKYDVYINNDMPDVNYAAVMFTNAYGTTGAGQFNNHYTGGLQSRGAGWIRLEPHNSSSPVDATNNDIAIFR